MRDVVLLKKMAYFILRHCTAKIVTVVSKDRGASTRVRQSKKCVH